MTEPSNLERGRERESSFKLNGAALSLLFLNAEVNS